MRLAPLVLIETVAFLLVIGETYLFFAVVVPLGAVPKNPLEYTGMAALKIGLTFGLGVLWFLVIAALTRAYVSSRIRRQIPTPST